MSEEEILKRTVCGIGINDAPYNVVRKGNMNGKTWTCPYYVVWSSMLCRCYSETEHKRHPTYIGCYTVPEWHYFMTFRAWMSEQDWEGKELDKDLLYKGNKVYGPETCLFISSRVNSFITECTASRGSYPVGVSFDKESRKFKAYCNDVTTGSRKHLGRFCNPDSAHQAWLAFKLEQAKILATKETDEKVSKALVARYENYQQTLENFGVNTSELKILEG